MQAVAPHMAQGAPRIVTETQSRITTWEMVVYALLIAASLLLRVAELDSIPLSQAEARQALSVYRDANPGAAGSAIDSSSPVLTLMQSVTFGLQGADELTARILTALAGVLLGVSPSLFRKMIGPLRAVAFSLFLSFSPTLLLASRAGSGTVWALLFAMLGLWAAWRWWDLHMDGAAGSDKNAYGVAATAAFMALALLTEPGGPLLLVILAVAASAAVMLSALDAPDEEDLPGQDFLALILGRLRNWPWLQGVMVGVALVFLVSTAMLLRPSGMSNAGTLLSEFLRGLTQAEPGAPLFFPLIVSLFYEPWLWVLALGAVVILQRRHSLDFVERFLAVWVICAGAAMILYPGGVAAHALWLTIPLAGLSSLLVADALSRERAPVMWLESLLDTGDDYANARRAKWICGIIMIALLVMLSLHLQIFARGFLSVPDGSLSNLSGRLGVPAFAAVTRSMIWLLLSVLFIVVGYLMGASIWNNSAPARGAILATAVFALVTGAAAGWNASVVRADDPVEPWHITTPTSSAVMLRTTLLELARRETMAFPDLPLVVMAPDDGLAAWLVRDFHDTTFIKSVEEARGAEIVLLPELDEAPDLGGAYVGQLFIVLRSWDIGSLQGFDWLPWWAVRSARVKPAPFQQMMLWVRQDIYESEPFLPGR